MLNLLDVSADSLCSDLGPILKLVGIVVWGIKVVVPIILIVVGMIDLAKAVGEKDENKIKEAQNKLVRRAIAAVLVFLVVTFVGLVMGLIGADDYEECMECINHPFRCQGVSDVNSR
mgnify:CR=1 FL=1